MGVKTIVLILLVSIVTDIRSHHHHHHHHHELYPVHKKENSHVDLAERESNFKNEETTDTLLSESLKKSAKHVEAFDRKGSFSARRVEKMLEKAILQIITGDLSTANMLLLKSLNYTPEEVLAIRERELDKRKDEELKKAESDESLYENRAKHSNYAFTEIDSSSRYDPDVVDGSKNDRKKDRYEEREPAKNFDFEAYNRQAVVDYENLATKLELQQQSLSEPANLDYENESKNTEEQDSSSQNLHRSFDRAMEPHVIFKIPYDDSEFDSSSGSDERLRFVDRDAFASSKDSKHRTPSTLRHTTARNVANSFHASSLSTTSSSPTSSAATGHTPLPIVHQLGNLKDVRSNYIRDQTVLNTTESPESTITSDIIANDTSNATAIDTSTTDFFNDSFAKNADNDTDNRKISEYEGLEWIGEDVYRVLPDFADSLGYADENETSDDDKQMNILPGGNENDTLEYWNDAPDQTKQFLANINASSIESTSSVNLSAYQQLVRAHRRDQSQKALEDIKTLILEITGRRNNKSYNNSTSTNQVQREKLTMFSPTCQIPRNTDLETWTDPFAMNMHFQLNLTSGDHVVAAKLRIYKLPQENLTTFANGSFDEEEDDEKKIRISVYYYTKSLKRHRSKKRLMDSIVTPLTTYGKQLVLDVRQGLRFWRMVPRSSPHGNGNNHGLVIQIEDQDGRALKPALYIQQPSCADHDSDQKASQLKPALFVRACARYSHIVNGEEVTYVNCKH
ncbi:uncharacterized protein LOC114938955 isoform X2 [Nylanderia fulva]|uniref:uncharacterized protein LOC114938955 isoform X2 n=1 Tax=Nylanderia fulva TaxID=613905 RepID=UPI0010FB691C|nr:uncharacterized protein LOC114938955 isoform X2 [Nylanderia fulva]